MKNSKLIFLLRILQPQEFRKLGKMVKSPFFTQNTHLPALYQYLKQDYPNFDSARLTKPTVFKKIFPGYDYSDIKIRNLMRDLSRLIEDFLVLNHLQNEESLKKKMLASIYSKRRQSQLFNSEVQQIKKEIETSAYRDEHYFKTNYELNQLKLEALQSTNLNKRMELLDDSITMLNNFNRLSALQLETEKLTFSRFYSSTEKQQSDIKENIIYQIYSQIINLYQTEKLEILANIKENIIRHQDKIRKSQQLELLLFLINFAVGKMREDDQLYNNIVFELYQIGLNKHIIAWDGIISNTTFLNIVVTGAKAGQFNWVKSFIDQYQSLLSVVTRRDVTALAFVYFYFHKEAFVDVIRLLGQHHFSNLLQNIGARVYGLRAYYELFLRDDSYLDLLFDKIHAFEKFIRRNENLSKEKQKAYLNFMIFLRSLTQERSIGTLNAATQNIFKDRLIKQEVTISRSWLLKKIEE